MTRFKPYHILQRREQFEAAGGPPRTSLGPLYGRTSGSDNASLIYKRIAAGANENKTGSFAKALERVTKNDR